MIETERLLLREMTSGDVDDLLVVFGDPKVMASFGESHPAAQCRVHTGLGEGRDDPVPQARPAWQRLLLVCHRQRDRRARRLTVFHRC